MDVLTVKVCVDEMHTMARSYMYLSNYAYVLVIILGAMLLFVVDHFYVIS